MDRAICCIKHVHKLHIYNTKFGKHKQKPRAQPEKETSTSHSKSRQGANWLVRQKQDRCRLCVTLLVINQVTGNTQNIKCLFRYLAIVIAQF